jgi:hypothetical protein
MVNVGSVAGLFREDTNVGLVAVLFNKFFGPNTIPPRTDEHGDVLLTMTSSPT